MTDGKDSLPLGRGVNSLSKMKSLGIGTVSSALSRHCSQTSMQFDSWQKEPISSPTSVPNAGLETGGVAC